MASPVISSAALYFGFVASPRVPTLWLRKALEFFSSRGLEPDYFDVIAPEMFSMDETYDYPQFATQLINAVDKGIAERIGLYLNPNPNAPRSSWHVSASLEMENGLLYLGVNEVMCPEPVVLLRAAFGVAGEILRVRYGIAYKMLQADRPGCYAAGVNVLSSISDLKTSRSSQDEKIRRTKAWFDEMNGPRRYLQGMLRGTYEANLINNDHRNRIAESIGWSKLPGKLTPFVDNDLWLWELTHREAVECESALRVCSLLI